MDLLKAIVVGVAASAPVGPIAIFVIQRTLCKGFKPGFVISLGATVVDTVYAVVAMFALAFVQDFIEGNSIPIFICGGLIVIALGLSMALANPFRKMKESDRTSIDSKEKCQDDSDVSTADFLTACAMGFSNPGAIAVMLALMAFFGIGEERPTDWSFFPIILGIAGGSVLYWFALTELLSKFRSQFNMRTILWINRALGAIVIVLGLATLAEGIIRIFID
ncbi:MAG: LysE family translocator [Bacteroidales bacterium]|nr:LysE family translocator [Bacteroidales bacterium]